MVVQETSVLRFIVMVTLCASGGVHLVNTVYGSARLCATRGVAGQAEACKMRWAQHYSIISVINRYTVVYRVE